ncbi:MAG: serine hydrolase domain-containing protein [Bacteroidota bacterium]
MVFRLGSLLVFTLLIIISGRYYSDLLRLNPHHNPYLEDVCEDFESYFQKEMDETHTPGAALVIVKDTNILLIKGFGVGNIHTSDSIGVHTAFRIGSLSKGFASVLAAMLEREGYFDWRDPVQSYVPEFQLKSPKQSDKLTIQHILSQRTGLPRHAFTNLIEQRVDMNRIYREIRTVNLVGKVGEIYSYQNVAYNLIADISEKATGREYVHLLHDHIFTPLKMHDASCSYIGISSTPDKALPHFSRKGKWKQARISTKYYNAVPAGGINASISDMAIWIKLLLGNRPEIISPESLDHIFTPNIFTNNRNRYFHRWPYLKKAYYGMGWRVVQDAQDTIIYHGGYVNGFRSEIAINRKERIGICVLTNAPTELAPRAIPTFMDVYRIHKPGFKKWKQKRHWAFSITPKHKESSLEIFRKALLSSLHDI